MYPARAVQTLWLLKGGNSVRVNTYSVLKKYQTLTVPVNSVTCLQTRADAAAQIPMKISGKWFFYLLDKRGKFHNPELFDFVIGLNRSLKWSSQEIRIYQPVQLLVLSLSPLGAHTRTWRSLPSWCFSLNYIMGLWWTTLFFELHHGSVMNHTVAVHIFYVQCQWCVV